MKQLLVPVLVNDQGSAAEFRGEQHDEGCQHPIGFFGILMSLEKLAWHVDQQVVEFGR